MAKKKNNDDAFIDVNKSIMNDLSAISDEIEINKEEDESEDDFEKLLNDFVSSGEQKSESKPEPSATDMLQSAREEADAPKMLDKTGLGDDEEELAQAYTNFINSVCSIADMRQIDAPDFVFKTTMLVPNYKPSVGRKISFDASLGWDVLLEAFPEKLSTLNPNSSDEQFLNFAEGLSDQNLQLAIISYVEILIDIENCEISYEQKRIKAQRKRIEKAIYMEYQRRRERKKRFIDAVKNKNFPIDAERLMNNYFKTASKDAEAAYQVLTTNPAVYAPIESEKIKPRMFGLIKPKPEDGIRENHRIGAFLKKLKA